MTAQIFTAQVKEPSNYSLDRGAGGGYTLDASTVAALAALTTSNYPKDVLAILNRNYARAHQVTPNGIGHGVSFPGGPGIED